MFKPGDKIIYNHDLSDYFNMNSDYYHDNGHDDILIRGKQYTIIYIFGDSTIYFELEGEGTFAFQSKYFITLKDYRKVKLQKIKNEKIV